MSANFQLTDIKSLLYNLAFGLKKVVRYPNRVSIETNAFQIITDNDGVRNDTNRGIDNVALLAYKPYTLFPLFPFNALG